MPGILPGVGTSIKTRDTNMIKIQVFDFHFIYLKSHTQVNPFNVDLIHTNMHTK